MLALVLLACKPGPDGTVVRLETRDGIVLAADLYRGAPDAPGVVLLHMVPPSWDRTSWPPDFIELLGAHGWWVLVPDRRGAGESGGDPEDAYQGPKGRYDVEACATELAAQGAGSLAIVGASNGTTSMLDYAVWAPGEGLPEPVALGFMTGGTYTENNTSMGELGPLPAVFTYSSAEADWPEAQRALDPGSWLFLEYPEGAHGTKMFDAAPEVAGEIDSFLDGVF